MWFSQFWTCCPWFTQVSKLSKKRWEWKRCPTVQHCIFPRSFSGLKRPTVSCQSDVVTWIDNYSQHNKVVKILQICRKTPTVQDPSDIQISRQKTELTLTRSSKRSSQKQCLKRIFWLISGNFELSRQFPIYELIGNSVTFDNSRPRQMQWHSISWLLLSKCSLTN